MPRVLRRIIADALTRAPGRVALAMAASLCAAVASLSLPRLLGQAVNAAQHLAAAEHARHALLLIAALVVLATAARGLFTGLANYEAEWVSQKVAYQYRLDFFAQLQRLSFGFHDRIHSGDLITRGMLDLEGARSSFIQNGLLVALTMVLLVGIAASQMIADRSHHVALPSVWRSPRSPASCWRGWASCSGSPGCRCSA